MPAFFNGVPIHVILNNSKDSKTWLLPMRGRVGQGPCVPRYYVQYLRVKRGGFDITKKKALLHLQYTIAKLQGSI